MSDRKTKVEVDIVTCAVDVHAKAGQVLLVLNGVCIGVQQGSVLNYSTKAMDQVIERAHAREPAPLREYKPRSYNVDRVATSMPASGRIKDPRTSKPAYHATYQGTEIIVPEIYAAFITNGVVETIPKGYWIDDDGVFRMKRVFAHAGDVQVAPRRQKKADKAKKYPRPFTDVNAVAFKIIDLLHDNHGEIDNLNALDLLGLRFGPYSWMFRDAVQRMVNHGLIERIGTRLRYKIKAVDLERLLRIRQAENLPRLERRPSPQSEPEPEANT